eukprot:Skav235350  [mRNA]  locus=scaffold520:1316000:1344921:- [translate_table: standard]
MQASDLAMELSSSLLQREWRARKAGRDLAAVGRSPDEVLGSDGAMMTLGGQQQHGCDHRLDHKSLAKSLLWLHRGLLLRTGVLRFVNTAVQFLPALILGPLLNSIKLGDLAADCLLKAFLGELPGAHLMQPPQHVAYCSQQPWVPEGCSLLEVVCGVWVDGEVTIPRPINEKAFSSALACACVDFADAEDEVSGTSLSGGQQARLALARAMYKALVGEDVCACVLDDVTAALDPQVTNEVINNCLEGPLKNLTTIFVSSDPGSWLEKCDKVIEMKAVDDELRVDFMGSPKELLERRPDAVRRNPASRLLQNFSKDLEQIDTALPGSLRSASSSICGLAGDCWQTETSFTSWQRVEDALDSTEVEGAKESITRNFQLCCSWESAVGSPQGQAPPNILAPEWNDQLPGRLLPLPSVPAIGPAAAAAEPGAGSARGRRRAHGQRQIHAAEDGAAGELPGGGA